jgi:ABC-type methionine transport system permease subunit
VKLSRLRIVLFGIALATLVVFVRFVLGTHLGILGAVLAIVIGLLALLYRAVLSIALGFWEVSGTLAQLIEETYRRRTAVKESSHATRLL